LLSSWSLSLLPFLSRLTPTEVTWMLGMTLSGPAGRSSLTTENCFLPELTPELKWQAIVPQRSTLKAPQSLPVRHSKSTTPKALPRYPSRVTLGYPPEPTSQGTPRVPSKAYPSSLTSEYSNLRPGHPFRVPSRAYTQGTPQGTLQGLPPRVPQGTLQAYPPGLPSRVPSRAYPKGTLQDLPQGYPQGLPPGYPPGPTPRVTPRACPKGTL